MYRFTDGTCNWLPVRVPSMVVAGGLSGIMVLIGLLILLYCSKRDTPKLGGLLPRQAEPASQ